MALTYFCRRNIAQVIFLFHLHFIVLLFDAFVLLCDQHIGSMAMMQSCLL